MSKVSIIVPVYNAGDKLHRCLQSIMSQTFKDWNLLIIDDGCSDNSIAIARQYEIRDDRIQIYHQPNSGSIAARCKGVELSSSSYVMFVDADDWIDNLMLKRMISIAEAVDADITVCNLVKVLGKSKWIRKTNRSEYFVNEKLYTGDEIFSGLIPAFLHGHSFPAQMHGKLYKRELLQTDGHFLSRIHFFGDDLYYNLEMFIKAKTVKVIPDGLYYYRAGGSTSKYMSYLFKDAVSGYRIQKEVVETYYIQNQDYHLLGIRLMLLNTFPTCLRNMFLGSLSKQEQFTLINEYCSHPAVQESVNFEAAASRCSPEFIKAIREKNVSYLYKMGRKNYVKSLFKKTLMNTVSKISFL
ncbi:glycosyltransferase [Paenibacillus sp. GSMTC-2017]|uniref:glycosyltransferase family 2 protein n=1 Tax=Paenibacillus sp. GSMTC-2017 TaxID=2794350 RepID=UPI0018D8FF41|nr:glycosyltransferase [Paenibacillus sp. GSMTC-2017]